MLFVDHGHLVFKIVESFLLKRYKQECTESTREGALEAKGIPGKCWSKSVLPVSRDSTASRGINYSDYEAGNRSKNDCESEEEVKRRKKSM